MENTLTVERGQSLFQTSTHTAHHWRPGYYFPSSNFKTVLNNPIPQALNEKDEVLPETHFSTTHKAFHDNKFPNQDLYNEPLALRQTKPLPSYKVNYISDVVEKLNSKPRRPLTMAFQKSEYKGEFEPHPSEATYEYDRPIHQTNNYLASDIDQKELDARLDKSMMPSRQPIDPSQAGVFNLLDPYMTTYNKEHKKWRPDEWKGIAKKDAVTIYDSEEVPKSMGFGTKTNPVPAPGKPIDDSFPMRDEIWFKTAAKQRQVHCPAKIVPNRGLTTETREMFQMPTDVKAKEAKICPIDTPFILPAPTKNVVFATPGMYKTEYSNIGRGRPHN